MFIISWLIRLFTPTDHLAPLKALMPELKRLEADLDLCRRTCSNPLDMIVHFFNVMSKWHDRGIKEVIQSLELAGPRYAQFLEQMKVLQTHFVRAGRDQYGMNRTEVGEIVTADNVYMGDVWGLWTKTVAFWKTKKDEPKGGWGHSGEYWKTVNAYDVICNQANGFMGSHFEGINKAIAKLETDLAAAASEPAAIKAGRFSIEVATA